MKKCPKCETTYEEDRKMYCRLDGTALVKETGCSSCGERKVTSTDKFCSYCGVEFQNA